MPIEGRSDSGDGHPDATRPEISVVIPTRNRRRFLGRALASALAQHDPTLEVIVIDDASTDDTREWLAGVPDPRLRVITHDVPRGVSAARNAAIDAAAGGWVAFLDDDDFWARTFLSQQLVHATRTGAVVVAGSAYVLDETLHPLYTLRAPADEPHLVRALFRNNVIGGPSRVMVRTRELRAVGGFDLRLRILADWDLWITLVRDARPALTLEPLVAVTQHEQNMQLVEADHIVDEIDYICEKHAEYATSIQAEFGGPELYRWVATQYRRAGRRREAARTFLMTGCRYRGPSDLLRGLAALGGDHHRFDCTRSRPGGGDVPPWVITAGSADAVRELTP